MGDPTTRTLDATDAELIARWQRGDQRSAGALVERHAQPLARFAASLGERDGIEELVHPAQEHVAREVEEGEMPPGEAVESDIEERVDQHLTGHDVGGHAVRGGVLVAALLFVSPVLWWILIGIVAMSLVAITPPLLRNIRRNPIKDMRDE